MKFIHEKFHAFFKMCTIFCLEPLLMPSFAVIINGCSQYLSFGTHHTRHVQTFGKFRTWQSSTTDSGEVKKPLSKARPSGDFRSWVNTDVAGAVMQVRQCPKRMWSLRHEISVVLTCPANWTCVTGRDHQLGWLLRYISRQRMESV